MSITLYSPLSLYNSFLLSLFITILLFLSLYFFLPLQFFQLFLLYPVIVVFILLSLSLLAINHLSPFLCVSSIAVIPQFPQSLSSVSVSYSNTSYMCNGSYTHTHTPTPGRPVGRHCQLEWFITRFVVLTLFCLSLCLRFAGMQHHFHSPDDLSSVRG